LNNLCCANTNRIAVYFSKADLIALAIKRLLHPLPGGAKDFSIQNILEGVGLIRLKFEIPSIFASFAPAIRKRTTAIFLMNQRELFLRHVAQTSAAPLALEIIKADCCTLFDVNGKEYIDLIGGISVANIGHRHPKVIGAIQKQLDAYLHIMVYGEFVEAPQVQYAQLLTEHLPSSLNSVYFTNSGTEATEGGMKLAKRVTGRTQIIAFNKSYHGSTQGALSVMGDEYWRNAFRPLLPDVLHLEYNSFDSIKEITEQTACVIAETVQAEAGIIVPAKEWLQALRKKCTDTGTLLILDEIQTGFGRTGKLWGFEHFDIVPDILLLGKALGGGMPLGAFIADKKLMDVFTDNPVLGHITTFGGHPVCCAAGIAAMKALLEEGWIETVLQKEKLFKSLLVHPKIKAVRSFGLWMAVEFDSFETNKKVIDACIPDGVLTDWFLFAPNCLRISPPLIISDEQIEKACGIIMKACDS
jgi:acetylornithine/succinyldiaminopimelate/putrescine aminotransferase